MQSAICRSRTFGWVGTGQSSDRARKRAIGNIELGHIPSRDPGATRASARTQAYAKAGAFPGVEHIHRIGHLHSPHCPAIPMRLNCSCEEVLDQALFGCRNLQRLTIETTKEMDHVFGSAWEDKALHTYHSLRTLCVKADMPCQMGLTFLNHLMLPSLWPFTVQILTLAVYRILPPNSGLLTLTHLVERSAAPLLTVEIKFGGDVYNPLEDLYFVEFLSATPQLRALTYAAPALSCDLLSDERMQNLEAIQSLYLTSLHPTSIGRNLTSRIGVKSC
ncbi:hypothetical protein NMY22_g3909 [Coprinellus aureogranulatus]|nr:hypothetical protein NMY22_g3909 [Coprinellus aureogranulatus]